MASQSTASQQIRAAIIKVAKAQKEFTVDDLNLPATLGNALGPTIGRMASEGLIVDTKRTINAVSASKKGRLIRVFKAGPLLASGTATSAPIFKQIMDIRDALENLGFKYEVSVIAKFLLALDARPFLVLSGISGIGKSSIVSLLAAAVGASFVLEPVMPQWTDPTEIIGYYDISLNVFTPGSFLLALNSLTSGSQKKVFYLLDEMNLAHVEYYLSPYLSVGQISGAQIVPFVPNVPNAATIVAQHSAQIQDEFYLFGTINVDETTKTLSPKVLDRSFVLEMNDFEFSLSRPSATPADIQRELSGRLDLLPKHPTPSAGAAALQSDMVTFLDNVYNVLRPINRHFGNRVLQDCARVIAQWHDCQLQSALDLTQVVDFLMLSRILPKLHGTSTDLQALRELRSIVQSVTDFAQPPGSDALQLTDSTLRLDAMIQQAELQQIYSFWS